MLRPDKQLTLVVSSNTNSTHALHTPHAVCTTSACRTPTAGTSVRPWCLAAPVRPAWSTPPPAPLARPAREYRSIRTGQGSDAPECIGLWPPTKHIRLQLWVAAHHASGLCRERRQRPGVLNSRHGCNSAQVRAKGDHALHLACYIVLSSWRGVLALSVPVQCTTPEHSPQCAMPCPSEARAAGYAWAQCSRKPPAYKWFNHSTGRGRL